MESIMRIGIIGTGGMGRTHALSWRETPATVAGFMSRSAERGEAMAREFGGKAYPSIEAMLPDVDAIDICTPTALHKEQTLIAAQAGKHVVCEKPFAHSVEDAQQMINACSTAGVKLLLAHVLRYFPAYADAKARVAAGEIGAVKLMRMARLNSMLLAPEGSWFTDLLQSGGVLFDMSIHDYDFARWVAGDVASVKAIAASAWGKPAAQEGAVLLTHTSGAVTFVEGSWAMPAKTFRTTFDLIGDAGRIEFDSKESSGLPANPYALQAQEFYETLAHDTPARVTAEDGLQALRIALAAVESASTGSEVLL
jgi:predicted dehydrogenase